MNNASTAAGRGHEGTNDAEPFFPSEGTFNAVVPLSEVGLTPVVPAPLPQVNAADVGEPAEADWARETHGAGWKDEEETTLVPARGAAARGARPRWAVTAAVVTLSVLAGLVSGAYLIWSAQRAAEAQQPAQVAVEAPALPPANAATPAPVAEEVVAEAKVERVNEAAKDDKASEVTKAGEVAKAEKSGEVARPAPTPRAERPARADAEAAAVTPAPKTTRSRSAAPARTRVTAAGRRSPAPPESGRALPVSAPPPSAKSSKVIQWP